MTSVDYNDIEDTYYEDNEYQSGGNYVTTHHSQGVAAALSPRCPFVATSEMGMNIEWIYKIPVFLVLACNMVFLVWIMAVS